MEDQPTEQPSCDPLGAAADAVRRARAELHEAVEFYHKVRQETGERWDRVRKTTVGDVLDGGLELARKRPGTGLLVAVAAGFLLGRWLKR